MTGERSRPYKAPVSRKYLILGVVASAVILLDQWTKFLALGELTTAFDRPLAAEGPASTLGERLGVMFSAAPEEGFDGLHYRQKRAVTVSESFFRLRYMENPGAAWGLFRSLPKNVRGPFFHVVSIAAVLLIGYYFVRLSGTDPAERWALWGLPPVLGGAIGNYLDRISRGFVIDFLEVHWYDKAHWPTFNIADAAICVGVGLLAIDAFVRREKKDEKKDERAAA
jgi:signal peptidase II